MVRLADPPAHHILHAGRQLIGVHKYATRFVDKLVANGFSYDWIFSQRSNFLRVSAEQHTVLCKHGLLTLTQAVWGRLKTTAMFHLKCFALAMLPSRLQKLLRTVSIKETAS